MLIGAMAVQAQGTDLENTLYMELESGRVVIAMRPDLAPNHVSRIKELVREGFYDGVLFHRVIEGFMAQTGDPTGSGTGGSGQKLKAEFSAANHVRGVVSMARAQNPDSGDSQFFIVYDDAPWLDGQYTVWGEVVEGMEHVDELRKGSKERNGMVDEPDRVVTIKVAADVAN
ncbi:MAG: peptidylprolyl isomerase [Alphaproteobacteria bacterium]